MNKTEIARKVVEYWYIIEFLNQNDFPYIKKDEENKENKENKERVVSTQVIGNVLSEGSHIEDAVIADTVKFNKLPLISETIEICIGKLKREDCMKVIYDLYQLKDERSEKTSGSIAIMGLQMTSLQRYVHGSFNISPLLWTMLKMCSQKNRNISLLIDEEKYKADMLEINEFLVKEDVISNTTLIDCFAKVNKKYVQPLFQLLSDYEGIFIYQRFKDEETKERNEENLNYSNLCMNFFTKDIQLMKTKLTECDNKMVDTFMLSYITSAYDRANNPMLKNRIDILKNSKEAKSLYTKVMHISNSPHGKWPSRYSPAFMQQFSINLAVSSDRTLPDNITVNGPPGTGKTTMLKEIIADAIVKKAMLMSSYTNSDDAFTKHDFNYGTKIFKGYHKYPTYAHFYEINQNINKHSILVASSNNAAVENISKELPDGNALCSSIKPLEKTNENERALQTLCALFEKNNDEDIYFTKYAKELFTNKRCDDDYYWGLVSVPLGNRKNQGEFTKILSKIFFELMASNDNMKSHKPLYENAVKKFTSQLEVVNGIRKKLEEECNLKQNLMILEEEQNNKILTHSIINEKLRVKIQQIDKNIVKGEEEIIQLKNQKLSASTSFLYAKEEFETKQIEFFKVDKATEMNDGEIHKLEANRTFVDFLYALIRKETLKDKELKELYLKKEMLLSQHQNAQRVLQAANKNKKTAQAMEHKTIHQLNVSIENVKRYKLEKDKQQVFYEKGMKEIAKLNTEIQRMKLKYEQYVEMLKTESGYDSITLLDEEFWNQFFSKDENLSIHAHLCNPWVNERYNREREILLYYALQVNKEFILSSYHARSNFRNLLTMWTNTDGEETVQFHEQDKLDAYPYLIQTLFALVPVISTTFASVQRFFENMKRSCNLGTLIIDEAGQAQPQMAIGAMMRCQKTIIVGDPKQVEPVVKDDLNAIKNLLKDSVREPYIDRHLSVQELADYCNPFGTYYKGDGEETWVGSPLVVHRRCMSPMFEISNKISYNQIMKQQTKDPSDKIIATLSLRCSQWLDVEGIEENRLQKNHYVKKQGENAIRIIDKAFELSKDEVPNLFVISPFTSVIKSFKKEVIASEFYNTHDKQLVDKWLKDNCGTVHTFQGKEANEVIFLLGCDRDTIGAIKWVNSNIINVAVTRAKYRICIIGEYQAWKYNAKMRIVKGIIDAFTIEQMQELVQSEVSVNNQEQANFLLRKIPTMSTFTNGNDEDSEIYTHDLINGLSLFGIKTNFANEKMLQEYYLTGYDFKKMTREVKNNLITGIIINKIVNEIQTKFDVKLGISEYGFLNIHFAKAVERHMRDCYFEVFKAKIPVFKNSKFETFMIGKVANHIVLQPNYKILCELCNSPDYPIAWWEIHVEKLKETGKLRNDCCHSSLFDANSAKEFQKLIFQQGLIKEMYVVQNLKSKIEAKN